MLLARRNLFRDRPRFLLSVIGVAAGGIAAQASAAQSIPDSRTRGIPETLAIVALALLAGLLGLGLVLRAERFRGASGL